MKGSNRTWVVLAALALVVGVFYYLLEVRGLFQESSTPVEYVWDVQETEVLSIRVANLASGEATVLQRSDARSPWRVVQPASEMADPTEASVLTYGVSTLRIRRAIEDPPEQELRAYGLISPTHALEVRLQDGRVLQLDIGIEHLSHAYYTREVGEQTVLMVEDNDLDQILATIETPPILEPPTPTPGLPVMGPPREEP